MYKLTNYGVILNTYTGAQIPMTEENSDYLRYLEWLEIEGNEPLLSDEPPAPTPEQYAAAVAAAIQNLLDTTAKQYNFDTIVNACAWSGALPVADALKAWGAACWIQAATIQAEVVGAVRPVPTVEEVLDEMPVFDPEA